jgi:hypothetical protein
MLQIEQARLKTQMKVFGPVKVILFLTLSVPTKTPLQWR